MRSYSLIHFTDMFPLESSKVMTTPMTAPDRRDDGDKKSEIHSTRTTRIGTVHTDGELLQYKDRLNTHTPRTLRQIT